MIDNLYLLYALVVLFFITAAILLIKIRMQGLFIAIPLMVAVVTSGIYTYESILGAPTSKTVPAEFDILAWKANESQGIIWLWIMEEGRPYPMSYEIPYNKQTHKQLHQKSEEAAKAKGAKGVRGTRKPDNDEGLRIELYKFVEQKQLRKDGEEQSLQNQNQVYR